VSTEQIPVSAFHFGSGYTSIGPKRYVFYWNRSKFPDAPGLMRRFHDAGMHVVANLKPCLLDDHPRYGEITDKAVYKDDGPVITQFWDGEGAHIDVSMFDATLARLYHDLQTARARQAATAQQMKMAKDKLDAELAKSQAE